MDKAVVDEEGTSNSSSAMVRNGELYIHTPPTTSRSKNRNKFAFTST